MTNFGSDTISLYYVKKIFWRIHTIVKKSVCLQCMIKYIKFKCGGFNLWIFIFEDENLKTNDL